MYMVGEILMVQLVPNWDMLLVAETEESKRAEAEAT
jgi:hypothetical protein